MEKMGGPVGMDESDPQGPAGHAYAIRKSTFLTSDYRRTHRKLAVDVTPQEVIDVLIEAGVKNWALMGLHGYLGYMPSPRATQDVDVMVPYSQRKRAERALAKNWPQLEMQQLSQVTRFRDPHDLDPQGKPKPAIDLMLPWGKFQEVILKEYVVIDPETQHRLPTLEAALVSKYATLVSPHRDIKKKEYDAGDFRRLVTANADAIQTEPLIRLASMVWENGGEEIQRFVDLAKSGEAFPI